MKKILAMFFVMVLALSLCACKDGQTNQTEPVDTTIFPTQATESVGQTEPSETTQDMVELVKSYIDKPIGELIAVIGEPEYSDYAPSCLGEGEDGMLYYDGFIVYTYREGDVETVYDVE